jgi:hypothetical protein
LNEWLSDGKIALLVDRFSQDPTSPFNSPVTFYAVHFNIRNLDSISVNLDHISVQFATADSTEKPFSGEIRWRRGPDDTQSLSHTIAPGSEYQEQTSGHFYSGKLKPTCTFTLYSGAEKVIAGPFRVGLGERVPQRGIYIDGLR